MSNINIKALAQQSKLRPVIAFAKTLKRYAFATRAIFVVFDYKNLPYHLFQ